MTDSIKILVVDDISDTAAQIARLLSFESDMQVVGTAGSSAEALALARELHPDIVLMDINMPDVDGIETTERLSRELPSTAAVMMSVQADPEYLRRSMLAGARGYLVKPFTSDELFESIRGVIARRQENGHALVSVGPGTTRGEQWTTGRVVAVFSPKGGVGSTTVAVNLAVAAAQMGKTTALVDADLQFGDVAMLLNLDPLRGSIGDVVADLGQEPDAVDGALAQHGSGVHVLLAPPSPDAAELVNAEHIRGVINRLAQTHETVVVDCSAYLNDQTLAVLDVADQILCVLSLDITAIRSARVFIDVAEKLGYREDKLNFVLNRADSSHGIRTEDVERSIGRKVEHMVVSDGRAAVHALNHGVPFVLGNRRARVSQDIVTLAESLFGEHKEETEAETPKPRVERRLVFARR